MALRLLRILPESDPLSLLLNLGGGAKSRAVNVPDLRSEWLIGLLAYYNPQIRRSKDEETYGLGITERSSKDDASGR